MKRYHLNTPRDKAQTSYAIIHAAPGSIVTITPPEEDNGGENEEEECLTSS